MRVGMRACDSWLFALIGLSTAVACQRVPGPGEGEYDKPGYLDEGVPVPGDDGADSSDPSDSGDSGPIDDINVSEQGTDTAGDGCHLVDLLFVVDNSNSMQSEQDNLAASFDSFLSGIDEYLVDENDVHVGIVSTDAYAHNPSECRTLGALVTRTPEGECGPFSSGNYMTTDDDLDAAFPCAAQVGIDGDSDEHTAEAAIRAVGPEMSDDGECNAGFIRDDALLVMVVITDEDDADSPFPDQDGSPGSPGDWFEQIVEQKGGLESNIVVLGLIGTPPPNACEGTDPFTGASYAPRLTDFVEHFTYGRVGDVCADDYGTFFDDSLEIIFDACQDFEPVG